MKILLAITSVAAGLIALSNTIILYSNLMIFLRYIGHGFHSEEWPAKRYVGPALTAVPSSIAHAIQVTIEKEGEHSEHFEEIPEEEKRAMYAQELHRKA